jgi:nicotinate-nucleotide--dimethylbenzimidazole phosphoribosyltransferase
MDKHRLDLALSAGRHAAERAKLAGVERLVGFAPLLDSETGRDLPGRAGFGKAAASIPHCCVWSLRTDVSRRDPYAVLSCPGLPEIAALVGVAIAGAQMGVSICLPGPAGEVVSHLAVLLNHGVSAWLDPAPFCMGAIQQAPIVHRTMSSR